MLDEGRLKETAQQLVCKKPPLCKGRCQLTEYFARLRITRGAEGYARKMTTTGYAGGCVFMDQQYVEEIFGIHSFGQYNLRPFTDTNSVICKIRR